MGARRDRSVPVLQGTCAQVSTDQGGRPLPNRTLSRAVRGPSGDPAVKIEAIEVQTGQTVRLTFESVNSAWRQGVWLATQGELSVAGTTSPQVVLWSDTAPAEVEIVVQVTDGLMRLYNVWDSGRRRGPFESQSATSGMLVETMPDGSSRYSCNDIGTDAKFDKLVFRLRFES